MVYGFIVHFILFSYLILVSAGVPQLSTPSSIIQCLTDQIPNESSNLIFNFSRFTIEEHWLQFLNIYIRENTDDTIIAFETHRMFLNVLSRTILFGINNEAKFCLCLSGLANKYNNHHLLNNIIGIDFYSHGDEGLRYSREQLIQIKDHIHTLKEKKITSYSSFSFEEKSCSLQKLELHQSVYALDPLTASVIAGYSMLFELLLNLNFSPFASNSFFINEVLSQKTQHEKRFSHKFLIDGIYPEEYQSLTAVHAAVKYERLEILQKLFALDTERNGLSTMIPYNGALDPISMAIVENRATAFTLMLSHERIAMRRHFYWAVKSKSEEFLHKLLPLWREAVANPNAAASYLLFLGINLDYPPLLDIINSSIPRFQLQHTQIDSFALWTTKILNKSYKPKSLHTACFFARSYVFSKNLIAKGVTMEKSDVETFRWYYNNQQNLSNDNLLALKWLVEYISKQFNYILFLSDEGLAEEKHSTDGGETTRDEENQERRGEGSALDSTSESLQRELKEGKRNSGGALSESGGARKYDWKVYGCVVGLVIFCVIGHLLRVRKNIKVKKPLLMDMEKMTVHSQF